MHTIRLRGPWQLVPVARFVPQPDGTYLSVTDDLPPPTRAKMPADWTGAFGRRFFGGVRYLRTFQKPTGLDEGQRVWLVIEPPQSRGIVSLSGEPLGELRDGEPPGRYDITQRLQEHNRLEIIVEHPQLDAGRSANDDNVTNRPGGLVGEVRLVIEE